MVSDGTKAGVLLGTLIPGFILVMITLFTLNIWTMIVGFILFAIGIGIWGWASGSHEARHSHNNGWTDTYMNRLGSANAKRNMWRGHRYSRGRRRK